MPSRNRQAGHNWEREIISDLAELLNLEKYDGQNSLEADIGTTRVFSKALDNAKVDIWFKENPLNLNLQAKNYAKRVNYVEMLDELPEVGNNVILHKYTEKAKKRFVTKGKYAIMPIEVFYHLLKLAYEKQE